MAVEFSFEFWDFYKALQKMKYLNFESGNKIHICICYNVKIEYNFVCKTSNIL